MTTSPQTAIGTVAVDAGKAVSCALAIQQATDSRVCSVSSNWTGRWVLRLEDRSLIVMPPEWAQFDPKRQFARSVLYGSWNC